MNQWIASLAGLLGANVSTLARETAQRVMSVWNTVINFFARVRTGWLLIYTRVRRWAEAQVRHALAVATRLRWLTLVYIPAQVNGLAESIAAWTRARLAELDRLTGGRISQLVTWAGRQVGELLAQLGRLRDWAIREVALVATLARQTAARVADLLGSPERLVAYILAPLTTALWRWVESNLERFGELLWRARYRIIARALAAIEDVLVRIM